MRLRKNYESHGQDFTSRTNWYYMWDWTRDQHTAWATGKPYSVLGYFEKGKSTYPSSAHTYETTPSITCPVTEEKNLQFFNSRPRKVGFGGKNEIKRQEGSDESRWRFRCNRQKPNKQSHVKSKTSQNHETHPEKTHFDNGLCCKSNRFKYREINGKISRNDTKSVRVGSQNWMQRWNLWEKTH